MHLRSLEERLDTSKRLSQLDNFIDMVKELDFPDNSLALSVSVGDGIWDYLMLKNNRSIKKIIATDIIDNPVKPSDQLLLKAKGEWEFVKIQSESRLPFTDETFDVVFHQDVVEHVKNTFFFLKEQHRVLKKGGILLLGTPNLFRPANILKLLFGRLQFPVKIGSNEEVGDYIHVQEFYEQQIILLLREVGFMNISVRHGFWGIGFLRIVFSRHPRGRLGRSMTQYLTLRAQK